MPSLARYRSVSTRAVLAVAFSALLTALGCTGNASNSSGAGAAAPGGAATGPAAAAPVALLNVSYDPTRELWKDVNSVYSKNATPPVEVKQSHGGSGTQARAVVDGLEADVVTLAMWPDTDKLREKGLIKDGWEERFPNRSLPYTSTIVFVVRKGNPSQIKDWPDLVKDGVEVITPNPKTSGNGKLSLLGAWGAIVLRGGTEQQATEYLTKLYKNVPVLDTGARGSTTTFAQKGIGDVHLTWENEAHLEIAESKGELELVYPPISILAEPHVAVVDVNVDKHGSREAAESYLKFLYTDEGQELIAKHFYRPSKAEVLAKHTATFPQIELFPVTKIGADWNEVQTKFFADGALFDSIYQSVDK